MLYRIEFDCFMEYFYLVSVKYFMRVTLYIKILFSNDLCYSIFFLCVPFIVASYCQFY